MGNTGVFRLAIACIVLVGCFDPELVPCGDLSCPVGNVCTAGGCATPADVAACEGMAEGSPCVAATGGYGTCTGGACRTGLCGNGVTDVGELCDDSNQLSGDGCRADCGKIERCGDLELDQGEPCDDGNTNPADGCDACAHSIWAARAIVGSPTLATALAPSAYAYDVAVDELGRAVIAIPVHHKVLRVEHDGTVTTLAGTGRAGFSGDGGPATSARLDSPMGVATDGLGRIYIVEYMNLRVRRVETDGTIVTIAGTGTGGNAGDGGPATNAQLEGPIDVRVDSLGRVLIADACKLRMIDLDGRISTVAGDGVCGFAGDGGPATAAQLQYPQGIAFDTLGRVLFADAGNHRIRRLELDGTIRTIAGTSNGFSGDGGPATLAMLGSPAAVELDAVGRVLIADTDNARIRRIELDGTIVTIAGTGQSEHFAGDGSLATAASLGFPRGIAVDELGGITIAATSLSWTGRVWRIDANGTIDTLAGSLGGPAARPATSAEVLLLFLRGLAGDALGNTFMSVGSEVLRIDADGQLTSLAGGGTSLGDGGPALAAQLSEPRGLAVDSGGRVYIADPVARRIRRVDLDGTITTIAGTGDPCSSPTCGDSGPAINAQLDYPHDVAVDASGRIFIADTDAAKIRVIAVDGTITTFAGNGQIGWAGDGGPATAATLASPRSVAVDDFGRVFIATFHMVRMVDGTGTISTVAGAVDSGFAGDGGPASAARLSNPDALAIDPVGRVVISDSGNYRVRRIELDGTINTIAGNGFYSSGEGDGGPATSAMLSPSWVEGEVVVDHGDLAVDALGRVVVTDLSFALFALRNSHRVRRIDTTGIVTTIAGPIDPENVTVGRVLDARLGDAQAITPVGEATIVAGGASSAVQMIADGRVSVAAGWYPQDTATGDRARYRDVNFGSAGGVAFDQVSGRVFITETSANRIQAIDTATWTIQPLANVAGSAGNLDGAAATASFRNPTGLFLDGTTLYIADTGNHAIRALDLGSLTVTTVVNVDHRFGFAGDGGPAASALLYQPTAITRCNDDLFIADTGNHRVRRIHEGTITTVLGVGIAASAGEGGPARSFPVHTPRGVACDAYGDLFVTSTTTVRMLPARDDGVVDGSGNVQTIYRAAADTSFPSSATGCLTGIIAASPTTLQVTDCSGLLLELARMPAL